MVARPPIEKWNRAELEDNYHTVLEQMRNYQKKNGDLEKKITQMNSKFRRAVMDRKPKEEEMVEKEKFDQLVNENQLLSMKLKSVKHQLLTYTTPTARSTTALAMTGRSTFRPPSTVRRAPPSSASVDEMQSGRRTLRPGTAQETGNRGRGSRQEAEMTPKSGGGGSGVRIVEGVGSHSDKAMVIRLNRQMREKNVQLNSLQYELEMAKSELAMAKEELERREQEQGETGGKAPEAGIEAEILRRELAQAKEELTLLAAANERLVKQSLSHEMDGNEAEIVQLKRTILELETGLKEAEKRAREAERRARQERRQLQGWKERERQRIGQQKGGVKPVVERDLPEEEEEEEYRPRQKVKKNRQVDEILNKLYKDVTSILESHEARDIDDVISMEMSETQKLTKWQKMYSELYEEMEKVRNMLLLQHNINQKQTSEITLLHEECDRLKLVGEKKLAEMKRKLEERQKHIDVLQQQIHEIAYSGQKPVRSEIQVKEPQMSTRLSLKLTGIKFANARGAAAVFMSLEFFDFELQTTPVLRAVDQTLDFTTEYDVVVSNLLVHYLQTNGISIELYRAKSTSYEYLAAGTVSLNELLGKGENSLVGGSVPLREMETGHVLATLSFELSITRELAEALGAYRRAETAQKMLPLDTKRVEPGWQELSVSIGKCTGLGTITRDPMEVCVVYELLAFSLYTTDTVIGTGVVDFKDEKKWLLPQEALQYFNDQQISLYLMDRRETRTDEGVLGMVSLPLAPLLGSVPIKGRFPLIQYGGSELGVSLEIEMNWTAPLGRIEPVPPIQTRPSRPERVFLPPSPSTPSTPHSPPRPQVHDVPAEEVPMEDYSEEEIESIASSERPSTEDTVREVEKEPSLPWKPQPARLSPQSSSESSRDTFTKEIREGTIEDEGEEEEELEEHPSHLADLPQLPPVARPRLSRGNVSLESQRSDEDNREHLVGFSSPLHMSIPPSDTSSVSSPRREKPPVPLPREGGRSAIKPADRVLEEEGEDGGEEGIVTISILAIRNTAYSPLMERRFEGVNFFVDWKFLDFPDEDCRVVETQPLPVIWNEPMIFDYTKDYHLSRRKLALLEQYIENQNHMEFCLVSDQGLDSEELAVASLELMRLPPHEPMLIPMLDVNGVRWADLELSLSFSPNIFNN